MKAFRFPGKGLGGFTLVEIMIVVAVIALLAVIATPSYLRARQRGQAATILEDVRQLDHALEIHALEKSLTGADGVALPDLLPYLKANSRMMVNGGLDLFSRSYLVGPTVADGARVDPATKGEFDSEVVTSQFWVGY